MKHYNAAQEILISIGGTAAFVAGFMGQYWPDTQTAKKAHQRPLLGRGKFGRNLVALFTKRQWEKLMAKELGSAK